MKHWGDWEDYQGTSESDATEQERIDIKDSEMMWQ